MDKPTGHLPTKEQETEVGSREALCADAKTSTFPCSQTNHSRSEGTGIMSPSANLQTNLLSLLQNLKFDSKEEDTDHFDMSKTEMSVGKRSRTGAYPVEVVSDV